MITLASVYIISVVIYIHMSMRHVELNVLSEVFGKSKPSRLSMGFSTFCIVLMAMVQITMVVTYHDRTQELLGNAWWVMASTILFQIVEFWLRWDRLPTDWQLADRVPNGVLPTFRKEDKKGKRHLVRSFLYHFFCPMRWYKLRLLARIERDVVAGRYIIYEV